ncbi:MULTISPECIES: MFS transporter [Methylomonas]|uniref:MFS transporter n=2 Tax=Methylomonas TaxID=416 RepID=A0A140E711_9GAMM|nr:MULTISPECIES: MFS transporter [Methylomonas]AMK79185.1 MFS transporter [Methylomonas denitrificans]OAH98181.1 MFS transporter [Methylomonas methanica]TCV86297.1 NNP family nitrate/nitrite transporter-like MFS transporter [Methylomonas methanica]
MSFTPFKLLSMRGKTKVLHMSWIAFFISFVIWFNHASLLVLIQQDLGISETQIEILLLLNVALTIPARVITGMLVDRFGAKLSYSVLLAVCSLPCFSFAMAENFTELAWSRFLLGFIGAGFVVGVRIIGDWFPASQVGTAEGIYAGWGNFGSAVAAIFLPGLAFYFGAEHGWRSAIALTGVIALVYSVIYYFSVENLPPEIAALKTRRPMAMEVTSIRDLFLYMLSLVPLYATISLLAWKLSTPATPVLTEGWNLTIHAVVWLLFLIHVFQLVNNNADRLSQPIASIHHYQYRQVFILAMAYLITFGSKLAVLSMLPMFFFKTFNETQGTSMLDAGFLASSFVVTNVVARPAGGWLSDKIGRKLSLYLFVAGLAGGYCLMAMISAQWTIAATVAVTLLCSIFMQAAEGAIFAFVPLVKRAITGEVAGIVGAYGNAGAIVYLILLTFVSTGQFFLILGLSCFLLLGLIYYLEEPKNYITEIMPDGSLLKIALD